MITSESRPSPKTEAATDDTNANLQQSTTRRTDLRVVEDGLEVGDGLDGRCCGCCGLPLFDPRSIRMAIGPCCASMIFGPSWRSITGYDRPLEPKFYRLAIVALAGGLR